MNASHGLRRRRRLCQWNNRPSRKIRNANRTGRADGMSNLPRIGAVLRIRARVPLPGNIVTPLAAHPQESTGKKEPQAAKAPRPP